MRRLRLAIAGAVVLALSGCGAPEPMEIADSPIEGGLPGLPMKPLWRYELPGSEELDLGLRPLPRADRVYVASGTGRLVALEAETGRRIWSTDTGRRLSGGPAAGEGVIVIGTRDGAVLALDPEDRSLVWESGVTSEVLAPAAIGQGTVVVRTNDGRVFALEPASGERRWLYDRNVPALTLRGYGAPKLVRGGVLVGFDNGRLAALTLEEGILAWEALVGVPRGRTDLERMVDVDGDPVVDSGEVFATAYQARVVALTLRDGRLRWSRDISSSVSPAVDTQAVYVAGSDGTIQALDRFTGAGIWRQDALAGLNLTAPVRHGDYLAVAASDGYLYWLEPESGKLMARRRLGDARPDAPPVVSGDVLYMQLPSGRVSAWRMED